MNEQVFTITTSACAVSLVISTPSFRSVPTITSASTRFLAQPSEIMPTRTGRAIESCFIKDRTPYVRKTLGATLGVRVCRRIRKVPRLDRTTAPVTSKSICAVASGLRLPNAPAAAPRPLSGLLRPVRPKAASHLRCARWRSLRQLPFRRTPSTTSKPAGGVHPASYCPIQLRFQPGSLHAQPMPLWQEKQSPSRSCCSARWACRMSRAVFPQPCFHGLQRPQAEDLRALNLLWVIWVFTGVLDDAVCGAALFLGHAAFVVSPEVPPPFRRRHQSVFAFVRHDSRQRWVQGRRFQYSAAVFGQPVVAEGAQAGQ